MHLSVLRYLVKSNSKQGRYDLGKQAENFFRELLNLIYGWQLKNMNAIQKNYPAIDLGDRDARICVQVTAENSSKKIAETLDTFLRHKLDAQYDRLIVLLLTDKKAYRRSFDAQNKIQFDPKKHIWDTDDLLTAIEAQSLPKLQQLSELIEAELTPIFAALAPRDSIFSRVEQRVETPPKHANRFLRFMEHEAEPEDAEAIEDRKQEFNSIVKAYEKLRKLSRETRGYLAIIVSRGEPEQYAGSQKVTINSTELENLTRSLPRNGKGYFSALEGPGLADYEDDYPPHVRVNCPMASGEDFFVHLKAMCKTEDELREIIESCDFTGLDEA